MIFFIYQIGIFLALRLKLKTAYKIADFIGRLYSFLSLADSLALRDNLRQILPDAPKKEITRISREVFINFCKYLVDFFRYPIIDEKYIKENIRIEGLEHLDKAILNKKGVILISAHIGNWEMGAVVLAKLGYNLNVVALGHKHKKIDKFFAQRRQMLGVKVISFGSALRKCFVCLAQNELLALVGDRDYFDNGVQVPFFNKNTIMPKGPAALSLRFTAPIVPTFMIRGSDDTLTFKFSPAIEYIPTGDRDADIMFLTIKCTKVIEGVVREHPEQWYVFRRFWKKIGWKL
ncbi:MAG: lysophospholipid acyltransferase family protein [Candidatus Omnitrophica bacterium]|nr:lysophospholipid acyltransferase family protein [Candidatus Omnitrophota bacterium]